MLFLSVFTAVLVIGLTAEHKRPDPAIRRLNGIIVRSRQCRREKKWLSFVSIIAGVHIKISNEVKNTSRPGLFPAGLSAIGASKAIRVNVPIVAKMTYAVIAQRGRFFIKDRTTKTL
jgi:hypothetical protein